MFWFPTLEQDYEMAWSEWSTAVGDEWESASADGLEGEPYAGQGD